MIFSNEKYRLPVILIQYCQCSDFLIDVGVQCHFVTIGKKKNRMPFNDSMFYEQLMNNEWDTRWLGLQTCKLNILTLKKKFVIFFWMRISSKYELISSNKFFTYFLLGRTENIHCNRSSVNWIWLNEGQKKIGRLISFSSVPTWLNWRRKWYQNQIKIWHIILRWKNKRGKENTRTTLKMNEKRNRNGSSSTY